MGFLIFMTLTVMIFPVILIIFGKIFYKSAPSEINYIYGYRTSMSMKNKDTWNFAHKFLGKLWFILGLVMLPVNLVPLALCWGQTEEVIGIVGTVLCFINLLAIVIPIIPTEVALKKNFNNDGSKK